MILIFGRDARDAAPALVLSLLVTFALAVGCDNGGTKQPDRGDFKVEYVLPDAPNLQALSNSMRENGYIELVAGFLNSAYSLPRDLTITTGQCDEANAFYVPGTDRVFICWELLQAITVAYLAGVPKEDELEAATQALLAWTWVIFHEIGHAMVDYYDLPITGREEDAVDDFSTLVFIEGGSAEVAIYAAAYFGSLGGDRRSPVALADEHGLNLQRFYNILCIVYGSAPETYANLGTVYPDMKNRLPRCQAEYEQKLASWGALLAPWEK